MSLVEHVLHQSQRHADRGASKTKMPVDSLRDVARDDRAEHRAGVDPHVEDREARVAPGIALRIQRPDERADARLQQARADHDERETGIEEGQRGKHEREVPEHDQDAAVEHAAVLADQAIGNQAAHDGGAPRGAGICAVERCALGVRESETAVGHRRHHVEQQERAHAVVAEALPHLREEERGESARMPEEARVHCRRRVGPDVRERVRKLGRIHYSKDNVEQWKPCVSC